ncbi:MAG: hypothetical protein U9N38_05605 [Thermodesulfobacteriota bacterium]|nr:hypothetical protein [Thermodesulfobacteriota bacterium]
MKQAELIHLCQPDTDKSCGACCGLYNYADSTQESLVTRLRTRTKIFGETVRGTADLKVFSDRIKGLESSEQLYEVIYCCEYLGFLDDEEKRVGCLLHPLQNDGIDMRDVSFYGRELCDGHFCPSYHFLSREEKGAMIRIINDWYLYGLCITDIDLVKEYFRFTGEGIYETPRPDRFEGRLKDIALSFFSLKISWSFRSKETNRFGKYYFDGSQYMISHIDYEALGCERSRFDKIFLSLASEFSTLEELRKGEEIIQEKINEFISCYKMNVVE